jgi:hypothetical protein
MIPFMFPHPNPLPEGEGKVPKAKVVSNRTTSTTLGTYNFRHFFLALRERVAEGQVRG